MTGEERDRIAMLLEESCEEKEEKPTARQLKNDDFPVNYYIVRKNFEEKANLMWRLGFETEAWKKDDEMVEHELRGMEHDLNRAPLVYEAREEIKDSIEFMDLQAAGIPYRTYTYVPKDLEREDETVRDLKQQLVVEDQSVEKLKNSGQYNESEIFMFADGYLPWIDEIGEGIRFEYERSSEVIEHLADGFDTLKDIADEYNIQQSELKCVEELKRKDLIETMPGVGAQLTAKGRNFYENELKQ